MEIHDPTDFLRLEGRAIWQLVSLLGTLSLKDIEEDTVIQWNMFLQC